MRNHIYLHASNLEHAKYFRDDQDFQPVTDYDKFDLSKTFQNEWGRIKTKGNFYHIIIGHPKQENCPWCGSLCLLKKIGENEFSRHSQYCMQCINCGSHGPILNICSSAEENLEVMENIRDLIKQRFETRRQWDAGWKNPYD